MSVGVVNKGKTRRTPQNESGAKPARPSQGRLISSSPSPSLTLEKAQTFLQVLLSSNLQQFTPGISSRSFQDVIFDLSWLTRTVSTLKHSPLNHVLGGTSVINVAAFYNVINSAKGYSQAQTIKDSQGQVNQIIKGIISFFLALGALEFLPARVLSFMTQYLNIPAAAQSLFSVGRAAYWTVSIGTVMFGVLYLLFGIWAAAQIYQIGRYEYKKWKFEGSEASFLFSKIHAAPSTLNKRAELTQIAIDELTSQFKFLQERLKNEGEELSSAEIQKMFNVLFEGVTSNKRFCQDNLGVLGYDVSKVNQLGFNALQVIGLKVDHQRRQLKKEAKLGRVFGAFCVIDIKKARQSGLLHRLKSEDALIKKNAEAEFKALQIKARNALIVEVIYNVACFVIAAFGIAVTVMSFTHPVGAALIIVTLVMIFFVTAVDLRGVIQSFLSENQPGKYDQEYALFFGAFTLASFLISVGVTFGLGLSFMPLLVGGLGITLPSLAISGGAYVRAGQKQKNWDANHISIETFKQEFKVTDQVIGLFKKLPKDVRLGMCEQFLKQGKMKKKGSKYINQLAGSQNEDLLRACRKTSKFFWKAVNLAQGKVAKEAAFEQAEKIQKCYDLIRTGGETKKGKVKLIKLSIKGGSAAQFLHEQIYLITAMKKRKGLMETAIERLTINQKKQAKVRRKCEMDLIAFMQSKRSA